MTNYKTLLQTLIPGWKGSLAAHHVGYLGNGQVHRGVPYNALDPMVINTKLELMQSIGVDTIITTWQGPWAAACHQDAIMTSMACQSAGMRFALLLDPGGMQKWQSGLTQAQIDENVYMALIDPGSQAMLLSPAYVSPKYVLDFNTGASMVSLEQEFPSLTFLAQSTGFSWPMIPWDAKGYAAMNANPGMKVAGICAYFNDAGQPLPVGVTDPSKVTGRNYANSVWGGPARVLDHQGGQFLYSQYPTIQPTTPIIAIVTWDDYDEQTAIEPWIAAAAGINWSGL